MIVIPENWSNFFIRWKILIRKEMSLFRSPVSTYQFQNNRQWQLRRAKVLSHLERQSTELFFPVFWTRSLIHRAHTTQALKMPDLHDDSRPWELPAGRSVLQSAQVGLGNSVSENWPLKPCIPLQPRTGIGNLAKLGHLLLNIILTKSRKVSLVVLVAVSDL